MRKCKTSVVLLLIFASLSSISTSDEYEESVVSVESVVITTEKESAQPDHDESIKDTSPPKTVSFLTFLGELATFYSSYWSGSKSFTTTNSEEAEAKLAVLEDLTAVNITPSDTNLTISNISQADNVTEAANVTSQNITKLPKVKCAVLRNIRVVNETVGNSDTNENDTAGDGLLNGTSVENSNTSAVGVEPPQPIVTVTNSANFSLQVLDNRTASHCFVVMFYVPWCNFSVSAAPHFNALPRLFPDIHFLALNAVTTSNLNIKYGIIGVPTVLLFHGGKPVSLFNDTSYEVDTFAKFLTKNTGLEPEGDTVVMEDDYNGSLPSILAVETDYVLLLSEIFIALSLIWLFTRSAVCKRLLEAIRNNWREAEAQHEHAE